MMNQKRLISILITGVLLFSGVCMAAEPSLLFEKVIEHHGKGMVEYALPTAVDTNYEPQMVGYWIADFITSSEGKPAVALQVILYGTDYLTGRNVTTVVLEKGETCRVFFYEANRIHNMSNIPQYCYVRALDIAPSGKLVKLRHWVSRTPEEK